MAIDRKVETSRRMGRRKRRIEDKCSRLVAFSKKRGLKHAVFLFSATSMSPSSSSQTGGSAMSSLAAVLLTTEHSLKRLLNYMEQYENVQIHQKRCLEAGEITTNEEGKDVCKRFRTCKVLLQAVDRLAEENHAEEFSVHDMRQLEQELDAALAQTRLRKTQLMMEYISTLQEKVASAADEENIDEGGGLNDLATNQIN